MNKKRSGNVPRNQRMGAELLRDLSDIICRKLKNPLVTEMVSIVAVDVSRDLSHANVFLSVYSTDEQKKKTTFDAIKNDTKRIRFELAQISRARTVPELHFILDGSMEYGAQIDKLLAEINKGANND